MKTKTKIRKVPIGPLIDILLAIENEGIEFVDIEVTHVAEDLDKIKIVALENVFYSQPLDDKNINDIIAWQ